MDCSPGCQPPSEEMVSIEQPTWVIKRKEGQMLCSWKWVREAPISKHVQQLAVPATAAATEIGVGGLFEA
eukprot:1136317-Pelagomonas_calceolata.AAC.6